MMANSMGGGGSGTMQPGAVPSLLRTNSGLLAGNGGGQSPFSALVSPRTQLNGNVSSLLGAGVPNASSLMNRPFANGSIGIPMNLQQRAEMAGNPELFGSVAALPDGMLLGSQIGARYLQQQQQQQQQMASVKELASALPAQQQQQSTSYDNQQLPLQQPPPQQAAKLENGSSMNEIKLEEHVDQNGNSQQIMGGAVKLERQHLETAQSLGPVKPEQPLQSDSTFFLQKQQQQQHLLQLSGHNSAAATAAQLSLLQQQRIMQLQHQQQQQQILKNLPLPKSQLQQQQLLRQQSLPLRGQAKATPYEPGTCAKRLTHYMYHQQNRPQDNNIEYWRKFVAEYFAPNAKKRWCVSLYGSGRQTTGVFPQDIWHCEICNRKPGRGFETTVEVLPRLCQIKYESGTQEEFLYVDMPHESQNSSGQIVLDYAKAIQESVFEQLRVVREGHLRIIFNPDLKIASWEFCARQHEELIPRRSIIPQVSQLGAVVHKFQSAAQNTSALSTQDLQNNCNSFVVCARQLAKALEVPLVNDLGYTKRYVRCLQIAEVVNCMKDLIDYSKQTGTGPIDSLTNFSRKNTPGSNSSPVQHAGEQQPIAQLSNTSCQNATTMTDATASTVVSADISANNLLSSAASTSMQSPFVVGVLQGSASSNQEPQMSTANSPYNSGCNAQISTVVSTSNSDQLQSAPMMPSASNSNMMQASQSSSQLNSPSASGNLSSVQRAAQSQEADPDDSQSSVERILRQMMMSSQMNGGISASNGDAKRANGMFLGHNGSNISIGNAIADSSSITGMGFGPVSGFTPSPTVSALRTALANNTAAMNGRVRVNQNPHDPSMMSQQQQQQELGNQLLSGLRTNSFNSLHYDWKSS